MVLPTIEAIENTDALNSTGMYPPMIDPTNAPIMAAVLVDINSMRERTKAMLLFELSRELLDSPLKYLSGSLEE